MIKKLLQSCFGLGKGGEDDYWLKPGDHITQVESKGLTCSMSHVRGKVYVSTIQESDLHDSPVWNGVDGPPVSVETAENLAWQKVVQLAQEESAYYVVGRTSINRLNEFKAWYYQICYMNTHVPPDKVGPNGVDSIYIYVLMNGRVIEPKLEVEQRSEKAMGACSTYHITRQDPLADC